MILILSNDSNSEYNFNDELLKEKLIIIFVLTLFLFFIVWTLLLNDKNCIQIDNTNNHIVQLKYAECLIFLIIDKNDDSIFFLNSKPLEL